MSRFIDITGERYGHLSVIRKSDKRNSSNDILWECLCDCGKTKLIISGSLRHGMTVSCGCLQGHPTHGDWNKRIRIIWVNMIRRCYKESDKQYNDYGGRGIKVCAEWKDYFKFKEWAYNNGYSDSLTIERIKVNKGYNPGNCKWATHTEQANNRRSNKLLKIKGVTKTIAEWSRVSGTRQSRISDRIRLGWSAADAVFKHICKSKISKIYVNRDDQEIERTSIASKATKTKKAYRQSVREKEEETTRGGDYKKEIKR